MSWPSATCKEEKALPFGPVCILSLKGQTGSRHRGEASVNRKESSHGRSRGRGSLSTQQQNSEVLVKSGQSICRAGCKQPGAADCYHPRGSDHRPSPSFRPGELTYGTGELPCAFLEQPHDLGLLGRGTAAAHDSRALAGQLHELVLIVLEADLGWGRGRRAASANPTTSLQPPARRHALPRSPLH